MKIVEADAIRFNMLPILKEADGVIGFVLAYNFNLLGKELREYDEKRQELITKHTQNGKLDENKFIEEIKPLADYNIELDFRKISEDDLMKSGLKADAMSLLMNSGMVDI